MVHGRAEARRRSYMSDGDVASLANVSVPDLTRQLLDRCMPGVDHRSARGEAPTAVGSTPGSVPATAGAAPDSEFDETLASIDWKYQVEVFRPAGETAHLQRRRALSRSNLDGGCQYSNADWRMCLVAS